MSGQDWAVVVGSISTAIGIIGGAWFKYRNAGGVSREVYRLQVDTIAKEIDEIKAQLDHLIETVMKLQLQVAVLAQKMETEKWHSTTRSTS